MIGAPVHQRAWILPAYLERLLALDYPPHLTSLAFVVNDSSDRSREILEKFGKDHGSRYRRITITTKNLGYPMDVRSNRHRDGIYYRLVQVRNRLLDELGDEDCFLSVDTDVLVEPDLLRALMANGKDICSALIFNDRHNRFPNIMKVSPRGKLVHYRDFPGATLFPVAVTGAVYLMTADVARNVRYAYHRQGEDVAFCLEAAARGYGIWCDSRLRPRHVMYPDQL